MSRKKRKSFIKSLIKGLILISLSLVVLIAGATILWIATLKIPNLESFDERKVSQSTKLYDRTGEVLLYDVHENIKRTVVPNEMISRHLKNATVSIEDENFYSHNGVQVSSFMRAVFVNIKDKSFSQGGSTITQQVVKNSLLTNEKKVSRKLKEWILAIKLEKMMDKETILALYLNEIPYGGNLYGAEEASLAFFGKHADELTVAESAYLAALPKAPTYYSPYGNNREKLEDRKNLVLSRMLANQFISDEEYEDALKEEIEFKPQHNIGIKAPHFVIFIKEYLENKYGEKVVEEGGLKVITTIDYKLQEKAQEIVRRFAIDNEERFNAENASVVAINPQTGGILVMVGSRDYFDPEIDGNFNIALAHRQPGSSFKPFVYAEALNKGYTPDTVVFDLETEFQSTCTPEGEPRNPHGDPDQCYSPVNYDNVFRGPMTMRDALAQSINIPAIKFLYLSGLRDSLQLSKDMGITSLTDVNQYGLTLVLGGGEVSLLDMTSAYSVFANEGVRNPYTGILRVENSEGEVLEEMNPEPSRVLPRDTALNISAILSSEEARSPSYGYGSPLHFGSRDVAAKTGTTNDFRDAWIVGYAPNIALGAWAGNNDNSPMDKKVAGLIVSPMWNAVMQEMLASVPNQDFAIVENHYDENTKPVFKNIWQGGISYEIDSISGKLATEYTPDETKINKVVNDVHSILYWVNKRDPQGEIPRNPENDSQYESWEWAVQEWAKEKGYISETGDVIPTEYDDVHVPENQPQIQIQNFDSTQSYNRDEKVVFSLVNTNKYPLGKAEIYINDQFIGSIKREPFTFSFIPSDISVIQSENVIKIVAYDSIFNSSTVYLNLKVN